MKKVWLYLGITLFVLAGLFGGATRLEAHDPFCGSCHTAPEVTYLERSQLDAPQDLASAHYDTGEFTCIACHRGNGSTVHRVQTLALGAGDVLTYLSGDYDEQIEKAEVSQPHLSGEGCIGCHAVEALEPSFQNHHHSMLPVVGAYWVRGSTQLIVEREDPELHTLLTRDGLRTVETDGPITCYDCHPAHVAMPELADSNFLNEDDFVQPTCDRCHSVSMGAP